MREKTTEMRDSGMTEQDGWRDSGASQIHAGIKESTSKGEMILLNPLQLIEADLVNLMRANANLADKLEKERDQAAKDMKKLLLSLLPVLDGFDALFRNLKEREQSLDQQTKLLAGNFRAVRRKLSLALERVGVVPMEVPLGTTADPFRHEVAQTKKAPGVPDGTILEVIQTGYSWHDEILRFPLVVVAQNSREDEHG